MSGRRHVVGAVEDLPPGSRQIIDVDGRPGAIGVFNVGGEYHALANVCPHMGAPLCLGPVTGTTEPVRQHEVRWVREGEILRCPWHAWEFDIATATTLTTPRMRVRRYPVFVEDGKVIVET